MVRGHENPCFTVEGGEGPLRSESARLPSVTLALAAPGPPVQLRWTTLRVQGPTLRDAALANDGDGSPPVARGPSPPPPDKWRRLRDHRARFFNILRAFCSGPRVHALGPECPLRKSARSKPTRHRRHRGPRYRRFVIAKCKRSPATMWAIAAHARLHFARTCWPRNGVPLMTFAGCWVTRASDEPAAPILLQLARKQVHRRAAAMRE